MKIKKILASAAAVALTVSVMSANAFAADNLISGDLNLGKGWGGEFIDAGKFTDVKEGDVVTVEYIINNEDEYHLVQIANGCDGWPILACSTKAINNQPDDEFKNQDDGFAVVSVDGSVSYTLNADDVVSLQIFGMVIRGYDITVKSVTVGAPVAVETTVPEAVTDVSENVDSTAADTAAAETSAVTTISNLAGDVTAAESNDKNNADTGAEGVAAVAGIAVIAALGIIIAKKNKY